MKKLGLVLFFEKSSDGKTYDCIGRSNICSAFDALQIYANTPNPASVMVEGDSIDEVLERASIELNKMKDPGWVSVYVEPSI